MKKLLMGVVAGVLGLSSVAMADRGDRYSNARSEASSRYERGGSRSDYSDRGRSDRGYSDRGHSDRGSRSRSSFSFGFGVSSGGYGDSSYFGLGYSRGYSRGYGGGHYYPAPVYVAPAPVYIAPRPVYIAPPPVVVYERQYIAPSYYGRSYDGGGYYCR